MFGWEFPPFNSGGLGVACLGLTRSLSQRGNEVIFVMPKKLDVQTPWARMVFAESDGVEGYAINSPITPYITSSKYGRERPNGIYAGDLFAEVERYTGMGGAIAKKESFEVIYAHDWLTFGAGMEAKKVSGKPLIVHMHATEYDRNGGGANVNAHVFAIEKAGMETADSVVAVSELTKRIIVEKYGIPADKIRVVHNGIDETTVPTGDGLKRLRNLKNSGFKIVLFLGRITLQKGPDYFLKAAKKVLERDTKVMFVISGSGDMEEEIMQLTGTLGISNNVLFTGFLSGSDRHEMYTAADLFVMPSVSEPFGITPLESMTLGTPVLISKQSGVSEIVQHALKVDFWDIDEMANKILSIVGHAALSETLSNNAKQEAESITWTSAALKIDGIIHELVR